MNRGRDRAPGRRILTVRDGSRICSRPIESDNKELLRRGFDHLGAESRYRRFMSPEADLSSAQLAYLTEIDHCDHEALCALAPDGGDIVGVTRYVRSSSDPTSAEFAVAVTDDWHRRGWRQP
jgi:hypothetical protein